MLITVHEVKKAGVNPNQAMALISSSDLRDGKPFWYYIALDKVDDSDIYNLIMSKIKADNIEIKPTETDIIEYESIQLRQKRDMLLSETDKYMTIDYPISEDKKQELKEYRQSLRDITNQKGFPENVIWPEMPKL